MTTAWKTSKWKARFLSHRTIEIESETANATDDLLQSPILTAVTEDVMTTMTTEETMTVEIEIGIESGNENGNEIETESESESATAIVKEINATTLAATTEARHLPPRTVTAIIATAPTPTTLDPPTMATA